MIKSVVLLGAALLGLAHPALAAPGEQAAATDPAIDVASLKSGPYRTDAMALAEATMPEKPFSDMVVAMTDKGFRQGLGEAAGKLEEESPGIVDEMAAAIRSAMATSRTSLYRDTLKRYARLYSKAFTPDETAELGQFYHSPAGQRLIAAKYSSFAKAEIDLASTTTVDDVEQLDQRASRSAIDQMDGMDVIELMKFSIRPAFRKLKALTPVTNQLEALMANEESPEAENAVADAVQAVLKRRGLGD